MAIRVRCEHCRKKISMDEAFAGGVCRCPYCGQLNLVPADGAAEAAGPTHRPDAPGQRQVSSAEAAASAQVIPVARPVLIQGVVALALIGLLLVMIVAASTWYVLRLAERGRIPSAQTNGFSPDAPESFLVEVASPVVYVVDGSSGTGNALLDTARLYVWHSVLGLGRDDRFNLLHAGPEGVRKLSQGWVAGGRGGYERAVEFLAGGFASGSTDLDAAVAQAIEPVPKSVVVLAGKALKDPAALAAAAKRSGVVVHCISLGAYGEVTESMKKLCQPTGGQCRPYTDYEIIDWHQRAPPLP